jgi:hypothetical protein
MTRCPCIHCNAPDDDIPDDGNCSCPGRHGCGRCPACADWGDDEYHRRVDEELERMTEDEWKETKEGKG